MLVRDWMTRNPVAIGPETSIYRAWKIMQDRHLHHLQVVAGGTLMGILSDRDLRLVLPSPATSLEGHELSYLLDRLLASEVMTREVVTTNPQRSVDEAARTLLRNRIGALPVVEHGELVGIFTTADAFQALLATADVQALALTA